MPSVYQKQQGRAAQELCSPHFTPRRLELGGGGQGRRVREVRGKPPFKLFFFFF